MEALEIAFVGTGVAMALVLLSWLRGEWISYRVEYERDVGWHRMWHERIMDESNGHDAT